MIQPLFNMGDFTQLQPQQGLQTGGEAAAGGFANQLLQALQPKQLEAGGLNLEGLIECAALLQPALLPQPLVPVDEKLLATLQQSLAKQLPQAVDPLAQLQPAATASDKLSQLFARLRPEANVTATGIPAAAVTAQSQPEAEAIPVPEVKLPEQTVQLDQHQQNRGTGQPQLPAMVVQVVDTRQPEKPQVKLTAEPIPDIDETPLAQKQFGDLLKPVAPLREEHISLRDKAAQNAAATPVAPVVVDDRLAQATRQPREVVTPETELVRETGRQQTEQLTTALPRSELQQLQPQQQSQPAEKFVLPSGKLVHEQQVLDQVVVKLSTAVHGNSSKASLRLYPEELGEVKLELTIEHDKLKAHLHTQTAQVQEVLEKHMPRLRDALEQQGLKVDTLQVDIDNSQFQQEMAQRQQRFFEQQPGHSQGQAAFEPEVATTAVRKAVPATVNGINLRV